MNGKIIVVTALIACVLLMLTWQLRSNSLASAELKVPLQMPASTAAKSSLASQITTSAGAQKPAMALPASLRDTDIDGELQVDANGNLLIEPPLRNLFDYFLTTTGEESLAEIRQRLLQLFKRELPESAAAQAQQVLQQYLDYLQALQDLPDEIQFAETLDVDQIRQRKQRERDLRATYLTPEMASAFFAEDDAFDDYSLALIETQRDDGLSQKEKATRVQLLQENLPADLRKLVQISQQQATALQLTTRATQKNWSPAELQQQREQLLGADAAARLQQLDQQRAQWNAQVADYLQQRDALLQNPALAQADRIDAVSALRHQSFSPAQQNRLMALERIHDSQP